MPGWLELAVRTAVVGLGATLVMDLWALARRRLFGIPSLDYALVGRWAGHMGRGRFAHARISDADPIGGEAALGWAIHYASGVVFAAGLIAVAGPGWLERPTVGPALLTGLATLVFPFFIMQPAFGLGIAAARAPQPGVQRRRSVLTHAVFGLGLYLAAVILGVVAPA